MFIQKKSKIAIAALIALSGAAAQAQSGNDVQALKQTVEQLKQQLEELRSLLKQPGAASSTTTPDGQDGESQEALDARTSATKADIQGLRTDLENYKYDQSRLQERNIPSVTRNTRLGGTVTLGYETRNPPYGLSDSQTTAATNAAPGEPRKNGFRAPTATLTLNGNLYRDYADGRDLTYRLGLQVNTTSTNASNNSQVNLTDAWVRYSYEPATGNLEDRLGTITLGQQAVPFGLDAPALDPEVRAVINSALFTGSSALDVSTRQVGVLVQGDYSPYVDFTNNYRAPLLAYSLGFFNGNGPNKNDNNNARDWIARVAFTLPVDYTSWLRQLQIGTTYYKRSPTVALNTTATTGVRGENDITGFDINWTHLPYSIAYEWARGKAQITPTNVNKDGFKRGVGQYINFGYTFGEQFLASSRNQGKFDDYWPTSFQAFLRVDTFDPNDAPGSNKDRQFRNTLGLNVFFAETTRFQINYFQDRNQANTSANPATAHGLQAQFVAGF